MNKTGTKWRVLLLPLAMLLLLLIPVLAQAGTPQMITFNPPVTMDYFDSRTLDLSTVATGGGSGIPLTFSVLSGNATIAGTTLTLNGGGPVVVQASQAGDASYDPAANVWRLIQATPQISTNAGGDSVGNFSMTLKNDNSVWGWGPDSNGAIGTNVAGNYFYPAQSQQDSGGGSPTNLLNIASLSTGGDISSVTGFTISVKKDGTVYGSGYNYYGQLGDGSVTNRRIATQMRADASSTPVTNVAAVAADVQSSMLLKRDGTVWTVGLNYNGQLGNNSTINSAFPVKVTGVDNVIAIAAGGYSCFALKNDGTVWAWGSNANGKLGDGTTIQRLVPVQVKDASDPSGFLQGIKAVSAGNNHTIVLKKDGTVWAVGLNSSGQLGNNSTTNSLTWVQVNTLSNVTAIAGGFTYSVALKSDGTLWTWGSNSGGQIGNNTYNNQLVPYQVPGMTDVINISTGAQASHTDAIKSDGTAWNWGLGSYGSMGNGLPNNGNYYDSNMPLGVLTTPVTVTFKPLPDKNYGSIGGSATQNFPFQFNTNQAAQDAYSATTSSVTAIPIATTYFKNWTDTYGGYISPADLTNPTIIITGVKTSLTFSANFAMKFANNITFTPPATMTYLAADIDLDSYISAKTDITVNGDPDQPVIYTVTGPATIVNGHFLHITGGTGTIAVTASRAGNRTFLSTVVTKNITAAQYPLTIQLSGLSYVYDGAPHAASATLFYDAAMTQPVDAAALGLAVTFTYGGFATQPVDAKSYSLVATVVDALGNFKGTASGNLIISKFPTLVSWATPADVAWGTPLSSTQLNAVSSAPGIFTYTFNGNPASGLILPAGGPYTLQAVFAATNTGNYNSGQVLTVQINVKDLTPPLVTVFAIPAKAGTLNVPVSLNATDNVSVTGYFLSESAIPPLPGDAGWSFPKPASYTFGSQGAKILYAYAKDAAGNVSIPLSRPITIALPDLTPPVINTFVLPTTSTSLNIPITVPAMMDIYDYNGVTGWYFSERQPCTQPATNDPNWLDLLPTSYTFSAQGVRSVCLFAKDPSGNISVPITQTVKITLPDVTPPLVKTFDIPPTATSLIVPVTTLIVTDDVGVTGYLLSESATAPSPNDPAWQVGIPESYTFVSQGFKMLYAYAKDASGNISIPLTAKTLIQLADTVAPNVSSFTIPATSDSLIVPVNTLFINDDVGVTGYLLSESNSWPSASDPAWNSNKPNSYTFADQGIKTLYAFGKDASGNISIPASANVTISLADITPPTVNSFAIPATYNRLSVPVTALNITDNVGVVAYLLSEVGTRPAVNDPAWSGDLISSYTFTSQGAKTLYAFGKDAAGNISTALAANTVITLADNIAPVVDYFKVGATSSELLVPFVSLVASDNIAVTDYLISESIVPPTATDPAWTTTKPTFYNFATAGFKTLYAYAKDAAGNISAPVLATVAVTLADTNPPYPAGVNSFMLPASSAVLTVPIITLDFVDDVGVTGWFLSESPDLPALTDTKWSGVKPQQYIFTDLGFKRLYAFAKDAAGNISAALSATVVITPADIVPPNVVAFTIPASSTDLTVPVLALVINDNVDVTGYMVTESATPPAANDPRWQSAKPQQYTFVSEGAKTLYAFGKDAAGNVSAGVAANTLINSSVAQTDTIAPVVNQFTLPATSVTLTVPILNLVITDNIAVTGYLLSEAANTPSANDPNWSSTVPSQYTFTTNGTKLLYAFGKDAAGNVSTPMGQSVVINNLPLPKPVTWSITPLNTAGAVMLYNGNPFLAPLTVDDGDTVLFNISADAGYGLYNATGCGGALNGNNFTTPKITASCTIAPLAIKRNANGGNGSDPTIADAMKALQAYTGKVTLNDIDKIRYDVAPLDVNNIPQGNGIVDIADVILTLRRIVGIGNW